MNIVIMGAGGHAASVLDCILAEGIHAPAGCIGGGEWTDVLGVPVLSMETSLPDLLQSGIEGAFVAIGDNRRRMQVTASLIDLGFQIVNAVHPRAVVSPFACLGSGVAVMPGAVIHARSVIEDGAIINTSASVDHDCRIGRFTHLAPGGHLAGNVTLGEGSFLGVGASVIPMVKIGDWAVIGAGALVRMDIPANARAWGVPACIQP